MNNKNNNNNLPKGWRKVKLGEVAKIKNGKSNSIEAVENGKYIFFDRSKEIKRSNKYLFDCEAIIIPGEGQEFIPRYFVGKFDLHQRVYAIYEFSQEIIPKFLFYFLLLNRKYFSQTAVGSTVKSLRIRHFIEFPLFLPPLDEQKRIADILSAFDEKIEVNNKIIKTLEEMAQEIFKEWFVRFRFPGWQKVKFVDSELGKIPEEWEVGYLGDGIYSEIIKPKVKKFEGEKIYLATADVEKNEIVNEKTKISYNNRPIRANMEPVLNSIWFAKMINTYKVLFFFEGNKEDIEKYILSTGFMGIQALRNMQYYLYLFINSKEFHQIKDTLVQGAVQEAITNTNVKQIKFLVPPVNLLDEFNKKVEPLLIKAYKLKKENKTLAALRDLLLPKLMSGEIRV
jgi:type I restriction enzyme, S subunit